MTLHKILWNIVCSYHKNAAAYINHYVRRSVSVSFLASYCKCRFAQKCLENRIFLCILFRYISYVHCILGISSFCLFIVCLYYFLSAHLRCLWTVCPCFTLDQILSIRKEMLIHIFLFELKHFPSNNIQ